MQGPSLIRGAIVAPAAGALLALTACSGTSWHPLFVELDASTDRLPNSVQAEEWEDAPALPLATLDGVTYYAVRSDDPPGGACLVAGEPGRSFSACSTQSPLQVAGWPHQVALGLERPGPDWIEVSRFLWRAP